MKNDWFVIAATAGLCSLVPVLLRLKAGLRSTALAPAWPWVAMVWVAWLILSGLTLSSAPLHPWTRVLGYLAAVIALTPPIAVLGARRPTSRVWTWFVLVPLVLVFTWPMVPVLHPGGAEAFSLEEPMLAGYVLVLVMGVGNYLGLCFWPSALLWIAGLLLIVLPLCPATAGWTCEAQSGRLWGTLCLIASGWFADRQTALRQRDVVARELPLNRLWRDFRDLFGIVWARRIQERFNHDARQAGLGLHLGMDGLVGTTGKPIPFDFDHQSLAAAEVSLRWLLQKFVDSEWIDRRMK